MFAGNASWCGAYRRMHCLRKLVKQVAILALLTGAVQGQDCLSASYLPHLLFAFLPTPYHKDLNLTS
jgi:hypothetical protein